MRPDERDAAYLWDMLQAARDARVIAADLTLESLLHDRKSQLALSKALELVGEGAARLSAEFYRQRPQLQWRPIVGLRNRLVHDYWQTNFRIVWDVVTVEIPDLVRSLEALLDTADERGSASEST